MSQEIVRAPATLESTTAEGAREYSMSILKGAIGAVPYVGTLLNETLFEARARLKQQRLNEFFAATAEDVRKLKEDAIDREYLRSEDFGDLLEDLCLRVARTQSEAKRARYRSILIGALQGTRDPDFTASFLNILGEITEAELTILQGFATYLDEKPAYEARGEKFDMGPIDYKSKPWGFDGVTAKQIIQSLIAKGLLADDSHGRFDTEPFMVVIPTELGGRFLRWLSTSQAPEPVPSPQASGT